MIKITGYHYNTLATTINYITAQRQQTDSFISICIKR